MATLPDASGTVDGSSRNGAEGLAPRSDWRGRALLTLRIIVIVAGGYFFTGGITALLGLGLSRLGLEIGDAMLWSVMLGYLLYVAMMMWAFAAPPRHKPATVIFLGAAATMGLAAFITPGEIHL